MTLDQPTLDECQQVRRWRNSPEVLPTLRTREPLTEEDQAAFYHNIVINPQSNHRYYALRHEGQFVGLGGLTYLDRVPGEAEISLILGPEFRRGGLGTLAVNALCAEGQRLGLAWIIGECYEENPARKFWLKTIVRRGGSGKFESDRMFFRMRAG